MVLHIDIVSLDNIILGPTRNMHLGPLSTTLVYMDIRVLLREEGTVHRLTSRRLTLLGCISTIVRSEVNVNQGVETIYNIGYVS